MSGKKGRSGRGKTPAAKAAVQLGRIASGISRSGPGGAADGKVLELWQRDRIAAITIKEAKAKEAELDALERDRALIRAEDVAATFAALATGSLAALAAVRPRLEMLGLEPAARDAVLKVWDAAHAQARASIAATADRLTPKAQAS